MSEQRLVSSYLPALSSSSGRMDWLMMLAVVLVTISGTSAAAASYNNNYKVVSPRARKCVDLYDRYCRSLILYPERCYIDTNLQLCCQTCSEHFHTYSARELQSTKCYFGDRDPDTCEHQPTDRCYEEFYQYQCCRTCALAITAIPGCQFGDRDQEHCDKIQAHECYNPTISTLCCGTCAKYETNIPGCRYGDHIHLESRPSHTSNERLEHADRRQYTCAAYVGHFGPHLCATNDVFRANCCASCA